MKNIIHNIIHPTTRRTSNRLPMPENVRKGFRRYSCAVLTGAMILGLTMPAYAAGDPLTVENVRKYTRFHPRCGTSFLILVVIVSVFLYSVLPWGSIGLRVVCKLLLLPLVMGISYELLKWCGRSDNIATRIIRQPGIWVQHLTVFEPDDSMSEVAIAAVTPVLPETPEEGKW